MLKKNKNVLWTGYMFFVSDQFLVRCSLSLLLINKNKLFYDSYIFLIEERYRVKCYGFLFSLDFFFQLYKINEINYQRSKTGRS